VRKNREREVEKIKKKSKKINKYKFPSVFSSNPQSYFTRPPSVLFS
jgi:hypothetical protein